MYVKDLSLVCLFKTYQRQHVFVTSVKDTFKAYAVPSNAVLSPHPKPGTVCDTKGKLQPVGQSLCLPPVWYTC